MLDYDFLAVRIMKTFGWTIEYTLSLTLPVFIELYGLTRRARLDAAVEEFYLPYGAAKFGGKCAKNLFDGRGSIRLKEPAAPRTPDTVTPGMIRRANRKLRAIIDARKNTSPESTPKPER